MRASFVGSITAFAAATALFGAPAVAQTSFSISVSPTTVRLGDTFTVNGTSDCVSSGYTVTFSYVDQNGDDATATATGTTDASGEFTQSMTVPEAAVAGEDASVVATIADCASGASPSPSPSPGGTSNTVDMTIAAHQGELTVSPTSGEPGDVIEVSGTNCWGGDVVVIFTDGESADEVPVTLLPDRTFSGTYVLPDAPGGDYAFVAECPGTDFNEVPFTLVNDAEPTPEPTPTTGPTVAPPPAPPGPVDYTG